MVMVADLGLKELELAGVILRVVFETKLHPKSTHSTLEQVTLPSPKPAVSKSRTKLANPVGTV